jgi:NADH dehydrogenase
MACVSPALPLIGGGHTRFQPVYVGDVAEAIVRALADQAAPGATYELGGPKVYTFKELLQLMLAQIGRRRCLVTVPWGIARLQAAFLEWIPVPPLTRDQVRLLERDNVVSSGAKGLGDLGIQPTPVEAILPAYLDMYRKGSRLRRSR